MLITVMWLVAAAVLSPYQTVVADVSFRHVGAAIDGTKDGISAVGEDDASAPVSCEIWSPNHCRPQPRSLMKSCRFSGRDL